MKAKRFLPVWVLVLVVIGALAAMGVSYTLWTETLTITGTVNTGDVDVTFSDPVIVQGVDVDGEFFDYAIDWPWGDEAKVALCGAVGSSSDGSEGNNTMTVAVNGAYPSYHCKVTFHVTNVGSVPVLVTTEEEGLPDWMLTEGACVLVAEELGAGASTADCTLDIHFNDGDVAENGSATFTWAALAHQWNESSNVSAPQ